jgi:hypothetical protein
MCSTRVLPVALTTVVVRSDRHGLPVSPGRQSQTVPQRSRAPVAAAEAAVVTDVRVEPPQAARARQSTETNANAASFEVRAMNRVGRAMPPR